MEKITADSAESKSLDITQQNIEQLKDLFPDVFSEGKIDFEALKAVLGEAIDDSAERYNFTWNGKNRARQIAQTPSTGTLRPCKSESVNWDDTGNLFIEGDNLEVLKILQKSYHKKIKVIYIDVPYNTGNDFVYKDNFQDNIKNYLELTQQVDAAGQKLSTNAETSGRYHSDWLSMIYPRLKLARNLLKDDGVIFISIDDVEQSNLRLICDEIFGVDNFVSNIIWQKKFSRANDARYFSTMHDHILCYVKSTAENGWKLNLLPRGDEIPAGYSNPDNDSRGVWTSVVLSAKSGTDKLKYKIFTPSGRECLPPDGRFWSVNPERFKELEADGRIWFGTKGDGTPRLKTFLSEVQDGLRPNSIWFHKDVGHNQEGRQELKNLFEDKGYFDSPKPIRLIEHILKISSKDEDDIVLDFFAGSSTTAHTVFKLNESGDVHRRFIMVQLPEKLDPKSQAYQDGYRTIADISFARICRASKVHNGNGCKYYKLDDTNIRAWDAVFDNVKQSLLDSTVSVKDNRTVEDVLYEIFLKYGIELTVPVEQRIVHDKQVFVVGAGALIVCLDDNITVETVEGMAQLKQELDPEITQVVFKDAGFADSVVKTNAIQILKQAGIDDVKSI